MDYSLPAVVSLPVVHQPKVVSRQPAAAATTSGAASETLNAEATKTETTTLGDDDYDMLEDDDHDPVAALTPDMHVLSIASALSPESTEEESKMDTDTDTEKQERTITSFVEAMQKKAEEQRDQANLTYTENMATTFRSTKDARLDFFFEVLQNTDKDTIDRLAHASWRVSPLDTLRLIFQLRSILDGKGERNGFYWCLEYLRREHPKTFLYNLRYVPDHGYWKDLLNWLVYQVRDDKSLGFQATSAPRMSKASDRSGRGPVRGSGRGRGRGRGSGHVHIPRTPSLSETAFSIPLLTSDQVDRIERTAKRAKIEDENEDVSEDESETDSEAEKADEKRKKEEKAAENKRRHEERQKEQSAEAQKLRIKKIEKRIQRARKMFAEDAFYRLVHIEIARLFACALKYDKARMEAGKSVSLAAKWCPSLNQFHDKHTLIATTIAQILFPDRLEGEDQAKYVERVRQRLRTEYYVPLRKATPVLETFMSANKWDEIPYTRVPAVAMKKSKPQFELHDALRFKEYLDSVEKGEKTIAAAALMPHELVVETQQVRYLPVDDPKRRTMELQWQSYVERLKKSPGTLNSCMAMCDVSGSMSGTPMDVAIALSLLLSELTEPPFNSMILSFSASPVIHTVNQKDSLVDKVESLKRMDWDMNTDLQKAFKLILDVAVENNLPAEKMVKTLFVFSDMEFDQAVCGARKDEAFTNYNVIKRKFESKGYQLPQIIFWNLRASVSGNKPVLSTQPGVGMISGYSGMMMKVFLKGDDLLEKLDPIRLMEESINGKAFAKLKVID
ncbi:hypothetical protein BGW42_003853 [Actinomortierella wolfii]|nr:hypothetical protein BGW42_003853 [Actinomortierella wolfii]